MVQFLSGYIWLRARYLFSHVLKVLKPKSGKLKGKNKGFFKRFALKCSRAEVEDCPREEMENREKSLCAMKNRGRTEPKMPSEEGALT